MCVQLWLQLCELIAHNPDRVTSLPVEQVLLLSPLIQVRQMAHVTCFLLCCGRKVIRQGIGKFMEMTGRLWTALSDFYTRRCTL